MLRQTLEEDLLNRFSNSNDRQQQVHDIFNTLVKQAVSFESREEFDQFMSEVESEYFAKNLAKSPYRDPSGKTC